jgi:RNA polymerase sigma factor (sigma-70 family)
MRKKIHISNGAIVSDTASMKSYIKETGKLAKADTQSETELITQAQAGDIVSRDRLINGNLRFVIQVARGYQGMGLPLEDLVAFGNMGLFEAVEKFDCSKRVKFITFAVWYIRAEIQKALNDLSRTVRIPSHRTQTESYSTKSIHTPVGEDENKETYADRYLQAEATISLRDRQDFMDDLQRVLNQVPDKQRQALVRFYGIGLEYPQCMEQIAEELDITGERARQLVRAGEKTLRSLKGAKILAQYF